MQAINNFLGTLNSYIGDHDWFMFFLLGTGLFFTLYLGIPQFRYFRHAIRIVRGKFDKKGDEGDTSHFQALATALSGTVGTGNIAGVALAIHIGGPAALFWMLVTALFGMCTKFVEVTLSHKYREKTEDGTMAGGPMYYMKNANFTLGGKKVNLKWLAIIFAIATVISSFGTGNMPQVNSIADLMDSTFGLNRMLVGGVLAILLGFVIVGGIKRIASVTEKLVPFMAVIYIVGALIVIISHSENIIPSFQAIFGQVFSGSSAAGGFLGASVMFAFRKGVGRGLFSNEAGQGSAPIAHASAKGHEPVSEGMVAILEPFIDTIIICTITGLVILSSGVWKEKHENTFEYADLVVLNQPFDESADDHHLEVRDYVLFGNDLLEFNDSLIVSNGQIENGNITVIHANSFAEDVVIKKYDENDELALFTGVIPVSDGSPEDLEDVVWQGKSLVHSAQLTSIAFTTGFMGDFGKYIVTIGLLLFAFSTAISWSYYGDRAMTFLVGSKGVMPYRIVYILGFFVAAFTDTTVIWTFAGLAIAIMTIPNLIGIFWLRKDMKRTVEKYWTDFEKEYPEEK